MSKVSELKTELQTDYRVYNIVIDNSHPLFAWADKIAHLSCNLENAASFRIRQLMTSLQKEETNWSENEKEVWQEIKLVNEILAVRDVKPGHKEKTLTVPASGVLNYEKLDLLMKHTNNPDYTAEGLPIHVAQHCLKTIALNFKSFFEAMKVFQATPSVFLGRPQLPGYHRKGGKVSFTVSNQESVVRQNKKGHFVLKLPKTKEVLSLGTDFPMGKFKEVKVSPMYGGYKFSLIFDNGTLPSPMSDNNRKAGIDFGVNNLMAVVFNVPEVPALIFNGRPLKAINQYFNKEHAKEMSKATTGGKNYVATPRDEVLSCWRYNSIRDYFFKVSKMFVNVCVENRIDTVILGHSSGWKQETNIGKINNQNYVAIPFNNLIEMLQWRCQREGIKVVIQEESYTSQASFPDNDPIPVFDGTHHKYKFSGTRPNRGRYRTKDKTWINADLNAAANIMRKYDVKSFEQYRPDFKNVVVIKHPDYWSSKPHRSRKAFLFSKSKEISL